MQISPFKLERYFARYEFTAPYLLSTSDCEPLSLNDLLAMIHGKTMKMWNVLKLGYTESQGHPDLREEIATLYKSAEASQIMVAAPEEAIFIAMNSLLAEGDQVISTFPAYQSLYEIARSVGCQINFWKPRYQEGWYFDIKDLEKQISPKTKMLIVNFPHNPTGATLTGNQQNELIKLAQSNDALIFSDEMYRFLEYQEEDRLPSMSDRYEKTVSLCGMSKSFALAGLRIGWLVTKNPQWLERFIAFKDYTTICSSAPSEILALMGLKAREQILRRNHQIIQQNLSLLDDFFRRHKNLFEWHRPAAGPVGFPKYTGKQHANQFCQDLVDTKGVMLLPPHVYDFQESHFRIGFARKNMAEALEKLEDYVAVIQNRK
jgi:aspartate/methionine/tyrosine aminotransferase